MCAHVTNDNQQGLTPQGCGMVQNLNGLAEACGVSSKTCGALAVCMTLATRLERKHALEAPMCPAAQSLVHQVTPRPWLCEPPVVGQIQLFGGIAASESPTLSPKSHSAVPCLGEEAFAPVSSGKKKKSA